MVFGVIEQLNQIDSFIELFEFEEYGFEQLGKIFNIFAIFIEGVIEEICV